MFLWLSAMPWAMWSEVHWMVVPITAAVSYLLLGIGERRQQNSVIISDVCVSVCLLHQVMAAACRCVPSDVM
jgi:hypothetical protein